MKSLKLFLFFFILIISYQLLAQDNFKEYQKQQTSDLQDYIKDQDKAFLDFLKKDWQEFQVFQGIDIDEKPKPVQAPKVKSPKDRQYSDARTIQNIKIQSTKKEKTIEFEDFKEKIEKKSRDTLEVFFYGSPIAFNYDKDWTSYQLNAVNENNIANYWEKMIKSNYKNTLNQFKQYKELMHLNDWGYYLLAKKVSEKIYSNSPNLKNLFTWFILVKSAYDIRVGYNNNKTYLLAASKQELYGIPFLIIENKHYYDLSYYDNREDLKNIYTYENSYKNIDKEFDLKILRIPNFKKNIKKKSLKYNDMVYLDDSLKISLNYNKNLVDFYNDYPHSTYDIYFSSPMSVETLSSLVSSLDPVLKDKTEPEAINILLGLIQKSLNYKTDQEQFGREKCLFPEETLYYPFSDCEDRSVIFAYLVKKLLGLRVIGLDYPGHVATAVRLNNPVEGDYVYYNNDKFMICDPTYINAHIGMTMPQFKNTEPKIIEIKKNL